MEFAPTGSPYFNDLARAAVHAWGTGDAEDLATRLAFMRDFLPNFLGQFERGMAVREPTPLGLEVDSRVHAAMGRLEGALDRIGRYLDDGERGHLSEGVAAGREAVEEMFADFARLQAEEATFPRFSRSPYVHELLRVADGVARGVFPAEALEEKLAWMLDHCRLSLAEAPPHLAAEMMGGLEEMALAFQDGQVDHLRTGGERVRTAGEALVDLWQAASAPRVFLCPRCSQETLPGSWRCRNCGSALPGSSEASSHVLATEGVAERPVPAHFAALEKALGEFLDRGGHPEQFQSTLAWFAEGVHRGRREFEASRPPGAAGDLMEAATREAVEGVEAMKAALASGDPAALRRGLETVRGAAEKLVEAHSLVS